MQILQDKKIVLGISGGIAAYKIPELVRRLKEQGADIRVVMTEGAKAFITPLTLQAVSGNAVADSLLDTAAELAMGHIELAKWADLIIIAPATADIIARMTAGIANDLLTTICLATSAPIAIAPAMNQQMWHALATQANIKTLSERDVQIWGPGSGEQACGDVGLGRMLDVDELVTLASDFCTDKYLQGQHWVITAGPTREAIDPVRYISNHSSGKMGYAIAQAALRAGATVTLISGPVNIKAPVGSQLINVNSADEMHEQALKFAPQCTTFVACAAVADYRVAHIATQKIKKNNDAMQLELVKNHDIVADVAHLDNKPFMVGFAAETQNVEQYARGKLIRKNLDLIAANDVAKSGQGFNSNDNALTLYSTIDKTDIPLANKQIVAQKLVSLINQHYLAKQK
ncbi:bifunctional phosphopantothenoylcysteine decarboxylase/phosphopantothenate--cysteine ligase CoaBC [Colwellia sp. 4_MG-2023]|jgi:phosphopantothenoylcysteine decarboxylase/phosphopantothenate--cysteine ligase|uniref:bifunctional phosphopantothenoylcysteine decarboxylase/phosphopantothenate--cysteine ligase CoaBC n=1 Tax=unclassified Colwellia TaxID=196834 RepID=UPI001C09E0DD|nr:MULTISPECIES: bifunctional phosphopantothenoylcysteine decarboxylase/phosphopantothenate--cysteine ligase CoaBC [unclassified Colwellia]MBU2923685.1 bifunctional phosphopantothenoylcysteine decarboxylase/phosphopantothenate--cysteine ligase CoaBC [Colwellia sp. C2M11]MDO6486252.1 bifunctional phosphopantothenoylcysteine decarboxylase/phosphopantothenate--cysteine ligase CoaBC [Colwellia sp. 6_MG-2023]MDO6505792.1 bifunctional phosphopantothenoylcysteine decarboxylase/phosphopantothenate--cyst